jgi:hypothetical protein
MNIIAAPPIDPRSRGRFGDDLDGLLREFFQAEMPHPLPAFQPPVRLAVPPAPLRPVRSWGTRFRTALALAASIAVLALGLGLLSGKFEHRAAPVLPGGAVPTADKPKPMKLSIVVPAEPGGQASIRAESDDDDY